MSVWLRIRLMFTVLVLLGLGWSPAWAGVVPPPGAGSVADRDQGAHSWLVVKETGENWRLVHLPPRGFGNGASSSGQVRPAVNLESPPIAIAAFGPRVYLVYQDASAMGPDEEEHRPARVRVYSLRAVPVIGGIWAFDPAGRFDSHPFPVTDRPVAGAATDSLGRLVLLLGGDEEPASLLRLEDGDWSRPQLDAELAASSLLGFASDTPGLAVLVDAQPPEVWSGLDVDGPLARSQVLDPAHLVGLVAVHFFGGQAAWVTRADESLRVWSSRAGQERLVATIENMPGELSIAPIRVGGGRLGILERSEQEGVAAFRFVEVSLSTGEVLFDGPPAQDSPVTPGEFRMLAASLVLFMMAVLVLTFRPGLDPSAISIPEGTALAEAGRRLAASGVDFLLAALFTSGLYGVSLTSLVTGLVIFEPGDGWMAIPTTLLVGATAGTFCEAFFAWTPGKLLAGCRVIRLGTEARRLSVARSAQRNIIKWLTPPIAAMAMLDPQTRHRGDDLARAVVVVQGESPPPSEP